MEKDYSKKTQRDIIIEMHENLEFIKKELEGNGKPGLISRVCAVERWMYLTMGGLVLLSTLVGWGLASLV